MTPLLLVSALLLVTITRLLIGIRLHQNIKCRLCNLSKHIGSIHSKYHSTAKVACIIIIKHSHQRAQTVHKHLHGAHHVLYILVLQHPTHQLQRLNHLLQLPKPLIVHPRLRTVVLLNCLRVRPHEDPSLEPSDEVRSHRKGGRPTHEKTRIENNRFHFLNYSLRILLHQVLHTKINI